MVNDQTQSWTDSDDISENAADVFSLHENVQFNTLPLLALANQTHYRHSLCKFTRDCNKIYQEFLSSEEGQSFEGEVS